MSRDVALSIRHAQLLAAMSVSRAAQFLQLKDHAIDALVAHLSAFAREEDLATWDEKGAELEMAGRGDPLPDRIFLQIEENKRHDFFRIVENAVEVGIHDLYGAPTGQAIRFLRTCIEILESWGEGGDLSKYIVESMGAYGPPLSEDEIDQFFEMVSQKET